MVMQLILQSYPYYGSITSVLNTWADLGVFAYVLPFLIVFAVVYAILNSTEILGDNRGVQATIALSVGLMALVNDYVTDFFSIIFPYTGIGVSILLVALIVFGMMGGEVARRVWMPIGIVVFGLILLTSFSDYSWFGYGAWGFQYSWPAIVAGIVILGMMAWIVANPQHTKAVRIPSGHPNKY